MATKKRKPTQMELRLSKESKKKRRGSTARIDLTKTPYPKTITESLGIKPKKKSTK